MIIWPIDGPYRGSMRTFRAERPDKWTQVFPNVLNAWCHWGSSDENAALRRVNKENWVTHDASFGFILLSVSFRILSSFIQPHIVSLPFVPIFQDTISFLLWITKLKFLCFSQIAIVTIWNTHMLWKALRVNKWWHHFHF